MGLPNFRLTACKRYRKWDVTYRYLHIELIWCLSMVQYLQNNIIMKWTTRFTSFNGCIPLKYGSTTTPPTIAHGQNLWCQASNFTLRSPTGLGSNTFYQIQIQIQIQKFGFFKYKYKYKYFVQHWFKYKYKYKYIDSNTNTNTNTFNQIYLPKLFRSKIRQFYESQDICSWPVFPYV